MKKTRLATKFVQAERLVPSRIEIFFDNLGQLSWACLGSFFIKNSDLFFGRK